MRDELEATLLEVFDLVPSQESRRLGIVEQEEEVWGGLRKVSQPYWNACSTGGKLTFSCPIQSLMG